jgi:hypothetical protein
MSNDLKVSQERAAKVRKDKQELFDKVFCALLPQVAPRLLSDSESHTSELTDLAVSLTEAAYAARKQI